jgi:hypothetical protein
MTPAKSRIPVALELEELNDMGGMGQMMGVLRRVGPHPLFISLSRGMVLELRQLHRRHTVHHITISSRDAAV